MSRQKETINSNIIENVTENSLAWENGVRKGDVITHIDDKKVKNLDEIKNEIKNKKECSITLFSNGEEKTVKVQNVNDFINGVDFKKKEINKKKQIIFVLIVGVCIALAVVVALVVFKGKPTVPNKGGYPPPGRVPVEKGENEGESGKEDEQKSKERRKTDEEKQKTDTQIKEKGGTVDDKSYTPPEQSDYDPEAYYDPSESDGRTEDNERKSGNKDGQSDRSGRGRGRGNSNNSSPESKPESPSGLGGDHTQQSGGESSLSTEKIQIFNKDGLVEYNYGITGKYFNDAKLVKELENNSKYLALKRDMADMLDNIDSHIKPTYDREKFEYKIYGYTDSQYTIGNTIDNELNRELNTRISKERAEVIKDLLIENGINASQIEVIPMAYDEPVVDENGKEIFSKSRRIRMEIKY